MQSVPPSPLSIPPSPSSLQKCLIIFLDREIRMWQWSDWMENQWIMIRVSLWIQRWRVRRGEIPLPSLPPSPSLHPLSPPFQSEGSRDSMCWLCVSIEWEINSENSERLCEVHPWTVSGRGREGIQGINGYYRFSLVSNAVWTFMMDMDSLLDFRWKMNKWEQLKINLDYWKWRSQWLNLLESTMNYKWDERSKIIPSSVSPFRILSLDWHHHKNVHWEKHFLIYLEDWKCFVLLVFFLLLLSIPSSNPFPSSFFLLSSFTGSQPVITLLEFLN